MNRPGPIDGVAPSHLQLPPGPWATVFEALCAHFPQVPPHAWRDRFARGRVLVADGAVLAANAPHRTGLDVYYYREVVQEARLPVEEVIVHVDEHLIVVDKPHFLPVTPAGRFVSETLLARLVRRFDDARIAPLHRIDRLTAGLVMFSRKPAARERYQALFRERRIHKRYEALAAPLAQVTFPLVRSTRVERGEPFFRMREVDGPPNSETRIDVIAQGDGVWRYSLEPVTGRKHQLRVHMAALGAPILGDPLYPVLADQDADDFARPLSLLARSLAFVDPLDGRRRCFESGMGLAADA
ncbi:pseudouridine synthase [Lysobacter korlensis]|uniref:Pseudouridine synthase n=1 Tax=Lysobacter korlensis TaxID=553636 RepID=A0ABV6RKY3_9GAMM